VEQHLIILLEQVDQEDLLLQVVHQILAVIIELVQVVHLELVVLVVQEL
jgi:hypothetical protein